MAIALYISEKQYFIGVFRVNGLEMLISLIYKSLTKMHAVFRAFRAIYNFVLHMLNFLVDTSDLIQINDTGELQLSTAINKILNPSDNCDEHALCCMPNPHTKVLKCGDFCFLKVWARAMQLPVSWAFCLFSTW